jgi:hypothetical protein
MTDEPDSEETVEIPKWLARDAADLFGHLAKIHYQSNNTKWGDIYHGRARRFHDATGDDDWKAVGHGRFWDRQEDG